MVGISSCPVSRLVLWECLALLDALLDATFFAGLLRRKLCLLWRHRPCDQRRHKAAATIAVTAMVPSDMMMVTMVTFAHTL